MAEPEPKSSRRQGRKKKPAAARLQTSLEKLVVQLDNDLALSRLHLKHYHMSVAQFKRRTSQLNLPESIYTRYLNVTRQCDVCQKIHQAPSRSRISGLRAENFGDLLFLDHGECKVCLLYTSDAADE